MGRGATLDCANTLLDCAEEPKTAVDALWGPLSALSGQHSRLLRMQGIGDIPNPLQVFVDSSAGRELARVQLLFQEE
jgi:hypothetical protein